MMSVLVLLIVTVLAWVLLRPRADFRIRARNGSVRLSGKLPAAKKPEIQLFFERDLSHVSRVTVSGRRLPDKRLQLRIRGSVSSGESQRIRNFLQNFL